MTTTLQAPTEIVTSGKLLVSFKEAARMLSMGRSLLFEMHADGRLGPEPAKFGRKSLLCVKELQAWARAGCPSRAAWLKMRGAANG